jgi:hypothetical protein
MKFWEIAGALNKPFSPVAITFVSIDRREKIASQERIDPVCLIKRIFTFHSFLFFCFSHISRQRLERLLLAPARSSGILILQEGVRESSRLVLYFY